MAKVHDYRPNGYLDWLMAKIQEPRTWQYLGCLSFEDRSLAVIKCLQKMKVNSTEVNFIKVDNDSNPKYSEIKTKIEKNEKIIKKLVGSAYDPILYSLMYSNYQSLYDYIKSLAENGSENIIFDITCFPKRFVFPITKLLYMFRHKFRTVIATYAIPIRYGHGRLSGSYREWETLPLFGESGEINKSKKDFYLGVGHMPATPTDITGMFDEDTKLHLLFPFPGHPLSHRAVWRFAEKIYGDTIFNKENIHVAMFNVHDIPGVFDYMQNRINCESLHSNIPDSELRPSRALTAPYGPKPFSLAMALIGCNYCVPSYYAQPKYYSPSYSIGVMRNKDLPVAYAYVLQYNNHWCYSI